MVPTLTNQCDTCFLILVVMKSFSFSFFLSFFFCRESRVGDSLKTHRD